MANTDANAAAGDEPVPGRFQPFHSRRDEGYIVAADEPRVVFMDSEASTHQLMGVAQARLGTLLATMRVLETCKSDLAWEPSEVVACLMPTAEEVAQLLEVVAARLVRQ